jgi:hypothetical protein
MTASRTSWSPVVEPAPATTPALGRPALGPPRPAPTPTPTPTPPSSGGRRDGRGERRVARVLGATLVTGGLLWLLAVLGLLEVGWQTAAAGALIVVGAATAGIGLAGHRADPLVVVGSVLLISLAVAATLPDAVVTGGVGDRTERPRTAAQVAEPFALATGQLVVDLTGLELPGGTTTVSASVGAGSLEVVLPDDVGVVVAAHADVGEVRVLGETRTGLDVDLVRVQAPGRDRVLSLDLSVAVGEIEVRR